MSYRILSINPGSTSTKIALSEGKNIVFTANVAHSALELSVPVIEQKQCRLDAIARSLEENGYNIRDVDAVAARGGRLKPIVSGTYALNDALLADSYDVSNGDHASRLAIIIAAELKQLYGCRVFTVNPISVDELAPEARLSGLPEIERKSLGHALSIKSIAKRFCEENQKVYEQLSMIILHCGGGTTVSTHRGGRMIDVINDFEGAFTPERCGLLPNLALAQLCYSGKYTFDELRRRMEGTGGFYAYLGTKDFIEIEQMLQAGDARANLVYDAYLLGLKKEIGSAAGSLDFKVDAICMTGGLMHSKLLRADLEASFSNLAPVFSYPGSFEMEALTEGAFHVLSGKEKARSYPGGEWID